MIDPPRYPKVTIPIDNSFKKSYKDMAQSMIAMLNVELINNHDK